MLVFRLVCPAVGWSVVQTHFGLDGAGDPSCRSWSRRGFAARLVASEPVIYRARAPPLGVGRVRGDARLSEASSPC